MNPREDMFGYYEPGRDRGRTFEDRREAGARLANALAAYAGQDALVLAIPRGGVPVAAEIARRLDADLDVIVARKLGAPRQPELAIGAVASDGTVWLNADLIELAAVPESYLREVAREQRLEAERRELRFRAGLAPLDPEGRIAIVVDDGLATGATLRAALRSLVRRGAKRVIVAIPVGAPDTCAQIAREVNELVCLERPDPFYAVGHHYRNFDQTSDEEVDRLLHEQRARRAARPALHSAR